MIVRESAVLRKIVCDDIALTGVSTTWAKKEKTACIRNVKVYAWGCQFWLNEKHFPLLLPLGYFELDKHAPFRSDDLSMDIRE